MNLAVHLATGAVLFTALSLAPQRYRSIVYERRMLLLFHLLPNSEMIYQHCTRLYSKPLAQDSLSPAVLTYIRALDLAQRLYILFQGSALISALCVTTPHVPPFSQPSRCSLVNLIVTASQMLTSRSIRYTQGGAIARRVMCPHLLFGRILFFCSFVSGPACTCDAAAFFVQAIER